METLSTEVSLLVALVMWGLVGFWMSRWGWRIQRRYLAEFDRAPLSRTTITWVSALVGALTLVAAHERPGAPAIVVVAMVGVITSWVDIATHRLPQRYTSVMAVGVLVGLGTALLVDDVAPLERLVYSLLGALIWFVPLWIGNRLRSGIGRGDVTLAPVLGAMVGMLGPEPAFASLVLTFVSAGLAALWLVVVESTSAQTRMALGPWMIGSAIVGHVLWGVIPDWLA